MTKSETGGFGVSDRRSGFAIIDNILIDDYGPTIGAYGIAAYCILVRFARRDGTDAYPSYQTVAALMGTSRRTAMRAIARLVRLGLVEKENRKKQGESLSNMYALLDIKKPQTSQVIGSAQQSPRSVLQSPRSVLQSPRSAPQSPDQDTNNKTPITRHQDQENDDDASSFFVKANVDVGGSARGDHAIRSETQRIALLGHTVTAVDLSVGINNWDGFEQWIAQRTDEELRMVCLWCKLVDLRNGEEIEDGKVRIKNPVAFVRDGVEQHKNPSLRRSQIDEVDGAIQAYFEMVEQGLI